jgi:hypothetical protein
MEVKIFRRHTSACPHKAKGRAHESCGCPWWADPRPQGPLRSLGTTDRYFDLEEKTLQPLDNPFGPKV